VNDMTLGADIFSETLSQWDASFQWHAGGLSGTLLKRDGVFLRISTKVHHLNIRKGKIWKTQVLFRQLSLLRSSLSIMLGDDDLKWAKNWLRFLLGEKALATSVV